MVAYYYVDPGISEDLDSTVSGLKYTGLTADAGTDATKIVDAGLNGRVIPHGSYVWNSTRSLGAAVTEWDDGTDTITVAIANQAEGDSYYIITPFKKVGGAVVKALTAGDVIYVRAGTTDTLAAAVEFTTDGTQNARLSVIGMGTGTATLETVDGTATEAWHDASTTRPIIDGNNSAYYVSITADDFWQLRNLNIRNTSSISYPCLYSYNAHFLYVYNCIIQEQQNANGYNIFITGSGNCTIESCDIKNSNGSNVGVGASFVYINDTTINGGALGSTYGLRMVGASITTLINCNFGGVATHSSGDIESSYPAKIYAKNCKFNSTNKYVTAINNPVLTLFEENAQQVFGAQIATGYTGVATRVTDVVRDGGATSSVKIIPTANVGINHPFILQDFPHPTWRIWMDTGAQTVSVYIRGLNWASYPTAARLYLQAEYITDDTTEAITYATVVSDEVLTDNTTWVALNCAVNPHVASFVNLTLYLSLYEDATTGIYVDIKPVVT